MHCPTGRDEHAMLVQSYNHSAIALLVSASMMAWGANAEAETIFLTCDTRSNDGQTAILHLEVSEHRAVIGSTVDKNDEVTISSRSISILSETGIFDSPSGRSGFLTRVAIDRTTGAYSEEHTSVTTGSSIGHWSGACKAPPEPVKKF